MNAPLFKDFSVLHNANMLKELKTILKCWALCNLFLLPPAFAMLEESLEEREHTRISSTPPSVEEQLQRLAPFIEERKKLYSFTIVLGAPNPDSPLYYFNVQECLYVDSAIPKDSAYHCLRASFNDPNHLSILVKHLQGSIDAMHLDPDIFKCSEIEIKYPELLFSLLYKYGQLRVAPLLQFVKNECSYVKSLIGFPIQCLIPCKNIPLTEDERLHILLNEDRGERQQFLEGYFYPYICQSLEQYFDHTAAVYSHFGTTYSYFGIKSLLAKNHKCAK